jgi:hypothetical protein
MAAKQQEVDVRSREISFQSSVIAEIERLLTKLDLPCCQPGPRNCLDFPVHVATIYQPAAG